VNEKNKTLPLPQTTEQRILHLLGESYGIAPTELSITSDLIEDLDMKGDLDGLARFVQAVNATFDVQLRVSEIAAGIDLEELVILQDLINLVEDAMLE
jgi:hypothetical protein